MKEQVKDLIEQNKVSEAIDVVSEKVDAAFLLKASHNNLEKSYNIGLISFNDFKRNEAVIVNKLIDLL